MPPPFKSLQLTEVNGRDSTAIEIGGNTDNVRLLDCYDDGYGHVEKRDVTRIQVRITGMTCAACSNAVEGAIMSLNGVVSASVALLQNKADVVFYPNLVNDGDIKNAIEDAGFEAQILQEQSTTKPHGTLVGQFIIGGMTCAACVNSLEGILRKLPGVKRAIVALATSLGEVEYDPSIISKDEIVNAIEDAGFEASLAESTGQDRIMLGVTGISSDLDVCMLNDILCNMKGVRQFSFNKISSELDILFDTEILSPRALVDAINEESSGIEVHVKNPHMRMVSQNIEAASHMLHHFLFSLSLGFDKGHRKLH
ncbi:hypothetical protein M8C21_029296 [Ambrosia artemisiifolia]|uniref:HMA domain-containing protein n=1 Tax=Ambrosia artemisiifolia TaxID=4212 RepID=A0AAD5GUD4_AMBAR|nr:hypothetical protein M8C21_029296 [Ambrosia artemisiifolia]